MTLTACRPRYRADGLRYVGGCRGPQPGWTWTLREWENLDKHGDPDGTTSGLDYALCPDCETMWDRYGARTAVSVPIGPTFRMMLRDGAA